MRRRHGDGKDDPLERLREAARVPDGVWVATLDARAVAALGGAPSLQLEELAEAPGLAVVETTCRGPALELALSATLVVATPEARFVGGGALPPREPGTLCRLRTRVGAGTALGFWAAARGWSARRALSRGLVDALSEDARGRGATWVRLWREQPVAARRLMLLGRARSGLSERGALALERALFALSFAEEGPRRAARGFFE